MRTLIPLTTSLAALLLPSSATKYKLTQDLSYTNFFPAFNFFSGPDPTNGFVQYQDQAAAVKSGLVGYLRDRQSVFLGVDYKSKDARGRASVRLESKDAWSKGLLVADIRHMPASTCGSWPAYWLVGCDAATNGAISWPEAGEIDIVEGVNDYGSNAVTLHTAAGCVVDNRTVGARGSSFSGFMKTDDCNVAAPNQGENVGCSIQAPTSFSSAGAGHNSPLPSYGSAFNTAKGGIYAMELTSSSVSVWFIPRSSPSFARLFPTPASSTFITTTLDTRAFGVPIARFAGACAFGQRFRNLKIVFNTTFCGAWAGAEWEAGGCRAKTGAATCEEFVRENPAAFRDAYWEVAGLKWFQKEEGRGQMGKGWTGV